MKNKYFILAGKNKQEKIPGVTFLFPLKGYCVGMECEYSLEDIPKESFLYVNRILDEKSIESFKKLVPSIESKIKGIIFEDLGIYELLKNSKLIKILYASHALCGLNTIETFLPMMDSVIVSPDITLEETKEIANKVDKNIGVFLFGRMPLMYSRRNLLTNYATHHEIQISDNEVIHEPVSNHDFLLVQNEYGTVFYDHKMIDQRLLLGLEHIEYYFINLEYIPVDDLKEWFIDLENHKEIPDTTTGFMNQKTIYRLPPKEAQK